MHRNSRLLLYGVVGAALLVAAVVAPAAWATPGQNALAQTVPTRTPAPPPVQPTELPPPGPTEAPAPPAASTSAPVPTNTAEPSTPAVSCASTTLLSLTSDRQAVWPGATVVFTATLSNTGHRPLPQVALTNQLSSGLDPVAVLTGAGSWQGRSLRVATASLAPGQRIQVVYSARVAQTPPASALAASALVASDGCPRKTASVRLGMPPSQLPATGGRID